MKFKFDVSRDCDNPKLRKVRINLYVDQGDLYDRVDSTAMFAGPFFARRLARRKERMLKRAKVMLAANEERVI